MTPKIETCLFLLASYSSTPVTLLVYRRKKESDLRRWASEGSSSLGTLCFFEDGLSPGSVCKFCGRLILLCSVEMYLSIPLVLHSIIMMLRQARLDIVIPLKMGA